jgi:hypothetical protein
MIYTDDVELKNQMDMITAVSSSFDNGVNDSLDFVQLACCLSARHHYRRFVALRNGSWSVHLTTFTGFTIFVRTTLHTKTLWPSGLRRNVKAVVFGRGFESPWRQSFDIFVNMFCSYCSSAQESEVLSPYLTIFLWV